MKIMFMGTPQIASVCLEALAQKHEVVCVVTQTDKPKGRGHKLAFTPVKECATELGIDVLQPLTFKENSFALELEKYKPDVIIVVAYGKILPKYVLEFPKYGCINVHASLLPKYRGAAPIQWAIVNGEKVSGITTMKMDVGLDTGDMLLKHEIEITESMTYGELYDKMCQASPALLLETIDKIEEIVPRKQDDSLSCYASIITKENCKIDWNKKPQEVINLIRGMNPIPASHTTYEGKGVKIFCAKKTDGAGENGEIIKADKTIVVACQGGAVEIFELQIEGKKRMNSEEFLRGNKLEVGQKFR